MWRFLYFTLVLVLNSTLQLKGYIFTRPSHHISRSIRVQDSIDTTDKVIYLQDFESAMDARNYRPASIPYDTDVLGMLNFCLRNSDSVLSGPSRSKILNEATNMVFKAIMIGFTPLVDDIVEKLKTMRLLLPSSPCVLDLEERNAMMKNMTESATVSESRRIENCENDLEIAECYMQWLEDLVTIGVTHDDAVLGGIYDRGYKRLLTVLKDTRCRFPRRNENIRPVPIDQNICLSLLDTKLAYDRTSKTKELNTLSNIVARCVLYGAVYERSFIARYLDQYAPEFASIWSIPGGKRCQESLYLQALALLLKRNLAIAEVAITAPADDNLFFKENELENDQFLRSNLRDGMNSILTSSSEDKSSPNLRLFDTYQNAFYRVVEVCLTEIGSNNMIPQNEEVFQNFLVWEQALRRNLTMDLWNKNPAELVGTWELVDVAGSGSLKSIMTTSPDIYFESIDGVSIVTYMLLVCCCLYDGRK